MSRNKIPGKIKIKALHPKTGKFKEYVLNPEIDMGMQEDFLIGRHSSCNIVLNSPEVSRIHGRITCQNGELYYTDLGSTDGSQIDDRQLEINQNYILESNNLLRIGGYVLKLTEGDKSGDRAQSSSREENMATQQWLSGKLMLRCIQVINETHDVKTFRFVADPPVRFDYQPGQFVTLDLNIEGKPVKRSYTISSSPSRPHTLEITVKRLPAPTDTADLPPGLVSNWLHANLTAGKEVKIGAPMGKFTFGKNPPAKILLISAGSGITPMMSMSRWLCDTGADVDVVFCHSARSSRDIIFGHELESMAARYPQFKLAVTTTRAETGRAWYGYSGRFNPIMLQAIAADFRERTLYVCGPNAFMAQVKTMLDELGFPMENYHQESFGQPKLPKGAKKQARTKPKPDAKTVSTRFLSEALDTFTASSQEVDSQKTVTNPQLAVPVATSSTPMVVFTKSGKEVLCDEEDLILDIAEEADIEIPFGCRMGACGTCKLRKLEGEVCYDKEPDCETGYLLACIAKPVGRVAIEA
ncbi:MAG: FHA domain-containing protein [Prochloraceae cyanobacterium]